jgi:hypothetical protein
MTFRFVVFGYSSIYHPPVDLWVLALLLAILLLHGDRAQAEEHGFHATQSVLA